MSMGLGLINNFIFVYTYFVFFIFSDFPHDKQEIKPIIVKLRMNEIRNSDVNTYAMRFKVRWDTGPTANELDLMISKFGLTFTQKQ